jgi:hypothetical protein
MVNGAFFVPSGAEMSAEYAEASSVQPKPVVQIDQLTMYSGVFGDPRYYILTIKITIFRFREFNSLIIAAKLFF